jgi:flagellar hook-associated protein 2
MGLAGVGGLATGLDTDGIVSQLVAVERRPVTLLESRKATLEAQASGFSVLNTKLLALKTAADALANPGTFFPRSVTSSVETVAMASAAPGSTRGTYALTVTGLARGSIASATATKAALTDTVALADGSFTFKLGASGAEVIVPVTATTTLEQLVDAINDEDAGVTAAAVNAGTAAAPAWKLTLTSDASGSASDIVMVADGTTLGVVNRQTADDAHFSITGIGNVTRATNTFSDVIDGVTITLKASSGSTDLSVDFSKAGLQTNLQSLVTAYNDLVRTIAANTRGTRDAGGTMQPALLSGEVLPRSLDQALRSVVTTRIAGAYDTLSAIGITMGRDGTLTLDPIKLQGAMDENAPAVSDLMAGTSGTGGIADLLAAVAEAATRTSTGSVAVRKSGLDRTIADLTKQIDAGLDRLATRERVLRAQFLQLEKTIGELQQTQAALTSQLTGLSNLSRYLSSSDS